MAFNRIAANKSCDIMDVSLAWHRGITILCGVVMFLHLHIARGLSFFLYYTGYVNLLISIVKDMDVLHETCHSCCYFFLGHSAGRPYERVEPVDFSS